MELSILLSQYDYFYDVNIAGNFILFGNVLFYTLLFAKQLTNYPQFHSPDYVIFQLNHLTLDNVELNVDLSLLSHVR